MIDRIPVSIIGAGPFGLHRLAEDRPPSSRRCAPTDSPWRPGMRYDGIELRDMGQWLPLRGRKRHGTSEPGGSVLPTGVP